MLPLKRSVLLASAVCVAAAACAPPPSDEECLDLVERYAGQLLGAHDPDVSEAELLRLQREARVRAEDEPMLSRCRGKVSRRQYECAMHAPTADEIEKCLLP